MPQFQELFNDDNFLLVTKDPIEKYIIWKKRSKSSAEWAGFMANRPPGATRAIMSYQGSSKAFKGNEEVIEK